MNDNIQFQKFAAIAAIISAPIALVCLILPLFPVNFNFDLYSNPLLYLNTGEEGAAFWRWTMILDMLGYYLLIIPLIIFLWRWLKTKNPNRVSFFALCLLAYTLIGAIGAAILAAVLPPIISSYTTASANKKKFWK